jgi:hypothetical protein
VNGKAATATLEGSVMKVGVPAGIKPSEKARVSFSFKEPVPSAGKDDTGGIYAHQEGTFDLGNFLPTVVRYIDGAWDTRKTSMYGDVDYFDSSYYYVTFKAPGDYTVAATGMEVGGEGPEHTFTAGPVRDFEIQASNRYRSSERTAGSTTVTSYYFDSDAKAGARALDYGCQALEQFSSHFGPYPYKRLNICEAPLEDYGMEFTGQVLISADSYGEAGPDGDLDITIAHEVGHQWFALGVGSDAIGNPWLDESLTSYLEVEYALWQYGRQSADAAVQEFVDSYLTSSQDDVLDEVVEQPVDSFASADAYTMAVYLKGALFFEELEKLMGEKAFEKSLAEYYRAKVFENAKTGDLLGAFRANSADPASVDALYTRWIREVHGDEDVPALGAQ